MKQKITGDYVQTVELDEGEGDEAQEVEVEFSATATLTYQAAQISGPPESCYPEESEFDLESISIYKVTDDEGYTVTLTKKTMSLLREAIDQDFLAEEMWAEFDQSDES